MIVFTCGGTGGHIAPAITLAQELPVDYLFIGGNRLEKKMLQGFPFVEIDSSAKNPVLILKGIFQSIRLLRIHHPTAVFSTGGYVSFPVSVAAILLRIPLLILEENSIPGRVTRWLAPFAALIFCAYPAHKLPAHKTVLSGNPVPRMALVPSLKRSRLLVMGGSQGASKLNELVLSALPLLTVLELDIIWLTGEKNYATITQKLLAYHHSGSSYSYDGLQIDIYPFYDPVTELLPSVKLCISRAGAMSISELTAAHVPTLYVPFPFAADNHQYYNALHVTTLNAGRLCVEADLTPVVLQNTLAEMMDQYAVYEKGLNAMNQESAVEVILKELAKRDLL